MTNLDALPEEIIWDIASKLHAYDSMRLRLVCSALGKLVAPLALADLIINLNPHNYLATQKKLRAYAQRATVGTRWARTLTISSLVHTRAADSEGSKQRDRELREDLSTVLAVLNLHTFRWYTDSRDPDWAFEIFFGHLAIQPIRILMLDFSEGYSSPNFVLDDIFHLQNLTVSNICHTSEGLTNDLVMGIAKVIQNSHSLTSLTVETGCWLRSHALGMPTLHNFLVGNPVLTLKTLNLGALRITMDDFTTPYFHSLNSLTIRHDCINPNSETRAEIREVWRTLQREDIKLRRIETDINLVSEELLKYLEYCSGTLTNLVFREDEFTEPETQARVDNSATLFYIQILPQLANCLELLHIQTMRVNRWCFSKDNSEAIGKCAKLGMLGVSIVDLYQNHSIHVRGLLQKTVFQLPAHLELVTFNVDQVPLIA